MPRHALRHTALLQRFSAFTQLALPALLFTPTASAQLQPRTLYTGVERPLIVQVTLPEAQQVAEARILLTDPTGVELARSEPTAAGTVDLAKSLPQIWSRQPREVLYAQLVTLKPAPLPERPVGDVRTNAEPAPTPAPIITKIGPPLVIQPLTSPPRAELDTRQPQTPVVHFPKDRQPEVNAFSGVRVYVDKLVELTTDVGPILIRLRPDAAPNTAWNFRHLVEGGFYNDTNFHRVVPVGRIAGRGFVIQGGDPTGTGEGTPGYDIPFEPSTLPHDFGVVSMARDPQPNTAGAQFFIALSREETARLDGLYTAFAQVLEGDSVKTVTAISSGKLLPGGDRPETPIKIISARLIDAPPIGEGPKPATINTRGR